MSIKKVTSRLNRLTGEVNPDNFVKIDRDQWIIKPNTYSNKGYLISGEILEGCSYGGVSIFPVAVGYGLDEVQSSSVLDSCAGVCEEINDCIEFGDNEVARKLGIQVLKDLCVVLVSVKNKEDETLSSLVRGLNEENRKKYYSVIDCIRKIPDLNYQEFLANNCHKMAMAKGSASKVFLKENKEKLLEDIRHSYIPFMGDSTFEQDHWGLKKTDDETLLGPEKDFAIKSSVVPFSSLHVFGAETLSERLGIDLPNTFSDKKISPLKKKQAFEKSVAIVDALGKVDDPRLEDGIKKLWQRINIPVDTVKWDSVLAIEPDDSPIVVPVIVSSEDINFPTDYSPLQALKILDSLTDVTDFVDTSGSANVKIDKNFDIGSLKTLEEEFPGSKFPFGGEAPFSPPRRVNKEVK